MPRDHRFVPSYETCLPNTRLFYLQKVNFKINITKHFSVLKLFLIKHNTNNFQKTLKKEKIKLAIYQNQLLIA